jgi:hypothetical protein
VPRAAGGLAAAIGLANLVSTLTPDVAARARVLRSLAPMDPSPLVHALVVPASVALAITASWPTRRSPTSRAHRPARAWPCARPGTS